MSEPRLGLSSDPNGDPPDGAVELAAGLAQVVAATVIATPGVLRLETTLSHTLRRLGPQQFPRAINAAALSSADGVLVRTRTGGAGTTAEVTVDLALSTPPTAIEVALDVERRIVEVLADHGVTAAGVKINVLSIDTAPTSG